MQLQANLFFQNIILVDIVFFFLFLTVLHITKNIFHITSQNILVSRIFYSFFCFVYNNVNTKVKEWSVLQESGFDISKYTAKNFHSKKSTAAAGV